MVKQLKILIVDDNDLIQNRLIMALSDQRKFEISSTDDSSMDAVDKYFELKPDILILDLMLKSGTGFEVLENIRHRSKSKIVIVFTNFAYPFIKQSCIETGADYFFDKSFDFDKLIMICNDIFKERIIKSANPLKKFTHKHLSSLNFIKDNKTHTKNCFRFTAFCKVKHLNTQH
jgi:DNA-binding response OmpR family regulator